MEKAMFHRHVVHNGNEMDFDRAMWLMSDDLLFKSKCDVLLQKDIDPMDFFTARRMGHLRLGKAKIADIEASILQDVWDAYCAKHQAVFGVPFNPDVM